MYLPFNFRNRIKGYVSTYRGLRLHLFIGRDS